MGSLLLSNCRYACDRADSRPRSVAPLVQNAPQSKSVAPSNSQGSSSAEYDADYYDETEEDNVGTEVETVS